MRQLYFDYASTTPVDREVADEMYKYLTYDSDFGNPASNTHYYGWAAHEAVNSSRSHIAKLINASDKEIIFTSGATESNNLAIKGVSYAYSNKGKHIITCQTEHKAVLDVCHYLETKGYQITYLKVDSEGRINLKELEASIREETILVSIMYINNELGVIHPIRKIGEICRKRKILFHVDGAQAAGKIHVDVKSDYIDLFSISGGKIYGPKGIGVLYVRRRPKIKLESQIHGGGHEFGFRSGTLATHQIVGLGAACKIGYKLMSDDYKRYELLRKQFLNGICIINGIKINGTQEGYYPGIINITIPGMDGEAFMMALNSVAFSAGSACNSTSIEPSYVLTAIGLSPEEAHSSFRFSFGRYTKAEEVRRLVDLIILHVDKLRKLSPFSDHWSSS